MSTYGQRKRKRINSENWHKKAIEFQALPFEKQLNKLNQQVEKARRALQKWQSRRQSLVRQHNINQFHGLFLKDII